MRKAVKEDNPEAGLLVTGMKTNSKGSYGVHFELGDECVGLAG